MNDSALSYLKDVLGMEWLPLRGLGGGPAKVGAAPMTRKVHVVVSQPFTAEDQALLARMMKAVRIENYGVSAEICEGAGVGLILCPEVAALHGFKNHGDTLTLGARRAIYSLPLVDLRDGPAALVQQRKKLAWGHLQTLQSWLGEYP